MPLNWQFGYASLESDRFRVMGDGGNGFDHTGRVDVMERNGETLVSVVTNGNAYTFIEFKFTHAERDDLVRALLGVRVDNG